jgi:3D (Asp-Asp-Asp) domain-containing protein
MKGLVFFIICLIVALILLGLLLLDIDRRVTRIRDERDGLVMERDSLKLLVVAMDARDKFKSFVIDRMLGHFESARYTTTFYSKFNDDSSITRYGDHSPIGYNGYEILPGFTVAVDPKRVPMGSMLYRLSDKGWYVAGDKVDDAAIAKTRGMIMDVCVEYKKDAVFQGCSVERWKVVVP